jgi:hypothetical protein
MPSFTSPLEHQRQTGCDKGDINHFVELRIAHAAEHAHAKERSGNARNGVAKKGWIKSGLSSRNGQSPERQELHDKDVGLVDRPLHRLVPAARPARW